MKIMPVILSDKTIQSAMQGLDQLFNDVASKKDLTSVASTDDPLINNEAILVYQWIVYAVICQAIDVFGTVTNIINIMCFVKQGFKDPVNVSLLGLAISDLGSLVTMSWTNICFTPSFSQADLPFDAGEFHYLTGIWPHITFTRVSSWITVLITVERCLCITAPLEVKGIVTSKRVAAIVASVFVVLIVSVAPVYVVSRLDFKYFPLRNKTLIGLVFTEDREQVEKVSFPINNVFISVSAFVVITVCTIILVSKMKSKAKWRKTSTTSSQADRLSQRNEKVASMVVMISSLFIVCFFPSNVGFIVSVTYPEISVDGKYKNIAFVFGGWCFVLESINSSMNIFIYFHMSSKYRTAFRELFCRER